MRWAVRWTVRATYDRYLRLDSDYDRRRRGPELRSWLGAALAAQPGGLPVADVPAEESTWNADDRLLLPVGPLSTLLIDVAHERLTDHGTLR